MKNDLTSKYRPTKLEDVVGHPQIVKSLRSVLKDRRHKAFLFVGDSGVGKTTLARIMARMLGCEDHNIIEIDAATYTSIDDMRKIKEQLSFTAMGSSPSRMLIVDEAQGLSKQAWASLLKAVEEPGEHTFWAFCSTDAGKIPKTVQTRCLTYTLKPVRTDDLWDLAERVLDGEGWKISDQLIGKLVKAADGSPRRLLTLLAKVYSTDMDDGVEDLIDRVTVDEAEGEAIDIARAIVKGSSWKEMMKLVEGLEQTPETARRTILAYMTRVAIGTANEKSAGRAAEVIDAFLSPYDPSTGKAPLVLSLAQCVL